MFCDWIWGVLSGYRLKFVSSIWSPTIENGTMLKFKIKFLKERKASGDDGQLTPKFGADPHDRFREKKYCMDDGRQTPKL